LRHLEARLGFFLARTHKSFRGSPIPEPSRTDADGAKHYDDAPLRRLVLERVLPQVTGGGWEGHKVSQSAASLADLHQPTVRLFTILTIENSLMPGAVLRLRAYPFASKPFYGQRREVRLALSGRLQPECFQLILACAGLLLLHSAALDA
jgi:hypothetical protein